MKIAKYSDKITEKDMEVISRNLKAFENNFEEIYLRKAHKRVFIVYKSEESAAADEYIYYAENIEELNGWLYGAVMANNGIMTKRENPIF